MSAPINGDGKGDDPYLYAPRWARRPPSPPRPVNSNLPHSPPLAPDAAGFTNSPSMAPGLGGFNIDAPPERSAFEGDVAIVELRRRMALDPTLVPEPPMLGRQRQVPLPLWWLTFGFMTVAVFALGLVLAWFPEGNLPLPRKQDKVVVAAPAPRLAASDVEARPALAVRLIVEHQRAFANEPLPLGIALKDGAGGEKVTLAGLAAGTTLSAGTPLGLSAWQVAARDLGRAVAHAPKDFVGVMDAAVDLRSAGDRLVDSQFVRLEWTKKPEAPAAPAPVLRPDAPLLRPDAMTPSAAIQPLDAEEVAVLLRRGKDFLASGDIASARLVLRRAANAGDPQAALSLGSSFDPFVLVELGVLGFAPEPARARAWYQRAKELGSAEAARRLERLSSADK